MYQGTFAKKNRIRGLPAPPSGPPVLSFLVRSAEGLSSTHNWPFRWPLSPTPPQVIPKAMYVSRQLAGAVVWGGWSCTSAATRGQRALLRFFNSLEYLAKKNARAWPGWPAELAPLFPKGSGGAKPLLSQAQHVFFCFQGDWLRPVDEHQALRTCGAFM